MELSATLIFLGLVINRIVEQAKAFLPPADEGTPEHRRQSALILALSFILGAIAMVAVFPALNMFPEASSPIAGLIFTGVLVGGIANGWDFVGGLGEAFVRRTAQPQVTTKATMQMSASSVEAPKTPADVLAVG